MKQLAGAILSFHLLWLAFVIFGAIWTRGRRLLTAFHVLALVWGILVEVGPWPCPLTLAELYCEAHAGIAPYQGGSLLHGLSALVYPDLPDWAITALGVSVCALNLAVYGWRLWACLRRKRTPTASQAAVN